MIPSSNKACLAQCKGLSSFIGDDWQHQGCLLSKNIEGYRTALAKAAIGSKAILEGNMKPSVLSAGFARCGANHESGRYWIRTSDLRNVSAAL